MAPARVVPPRGTTAARCRHARATGPDYDRRPRPHLGHVLRGAAAGWVHAPEPGDAENRKWSLCHPDIARRTHHLQVVERRSDGWREWLAFRDHLRADGEARDAYAALKRRLAAANDRDRPRYRAGKAGFIRGAR
ncbi:GrpB family protein [Polymorphospora sp. NPDC050346]|uniref:GrpB family protein n=1 Tax=Polymorphospora sp. NPDC050346 TaxID=3155780 RepID=UPI0033CBF1EF